MTESIYQRMSAVFDAANVPGFLQEWRQTPDYPSIPPKFCAYVVTQEAPSLCCDDCEYIHQTGVTLHLYGTSDVSAERDALADALEAEGFEVVRERDLDDVRAGDYQYHRRFDIMLLTEV